MIYICEKKYDYIYTYTYLGLIYKIPSNKKNLNENTYITQIIYI
jgi:hypothetical protein